MMSRHLLPPNRTPLEAALADATAIDVDPTPLRHLADSTRCPVALLPWLSWALSVDGWDEAIAEQPRRQLIRRSIEIHKRKGTAGAVRRALGALGVTVEFSSWQDMPGPGAVPYTFGLIAWVNDNLAEDSAVLSPELYQRLHRMVDMTKPVRSHVSFRVGARFDQAGRFANAQHTRVLTRVSATPAAVQPSAAANPIRLASAARPLSVIRVTMEAQ